MNTFDQIARQLCKLDGGTFFRWALRERSHWQFEFDSWDDTRRLVRGAQPDRTNDLIAWLKHAEAPTEMACGIVELQVEAQRLIFPRLGVYELLYIQELSNEPHLLDDPAVFSVLINLTGENSESGWESRLKGSSVRPIVLNLRNRSAESLLNAIEFEGLATTLLPWLPLHCSENEAITIKRWLQLIGREPSPERRAMLREVTLIFAELSKKLVLWQKALEDWNMLESQIVLGWLKRGKEEGVVEKGRADLCKVIRRRLADPVPEDLQLAIDGTNDPVVLEKWFDAALEVTEVGELRKAMKSS